MQVFVSYSFEDKTHFENIADALQDAGLKYWKTGETRAGELLSKQLQDAISRSALCIFIATRHSISSGWCSAELGAFWGAGKRVLIFIADDSLNEEELPRQFQGHFVQRRIKNLIKDCAAYLAEIKTEQEAEATQTTNVTFQSVTKEELSTLIEDAIYRSTSNSLSASAFIELEALDPFINEKDSPNRQQQLQLALHSFLGLSKSSIDQNAPRYWAHAIAVTTSTGSWSGFAKKADWQSYNYVHTYCIFFRYDDRFRVVAIALCLHYVELDKGGEAVSEEIVSVGDVQLGKVTPA